MSLLKANAVQLGQSLTASQNFTWYQPASPDGTVRLGNGNSGSVTDLITVGSTGNLTFANSISLSAASTRTLTLNGGAGSNGLVIDANNCIGVGISPASSSFKLDVGGINGTNLGIRSTGTSDAVIRGYVNGTESATMRFVNGGGLYWEIAGTRQLTLDSAGNLGLGVTPKTWYGNYRVQQIGYGGALVAGNGTYPGYVDVRSNCYINGSQLNAGLISGNQAASYQQNAGTHYWYNTNNTNVTADTAFTFTQAMTLDASGRLFVGTSSNVSGNATLTLKGATSQSSLVLGNNAGTRQCDFNENGNLYLDIVKNNTTASAANVYIDPTFAVMYRSTSALKYKQDIRDLESIDINKFRPVRYKSKCENDDQSKDHFGIIADEVLEAGFPELVILGVENEPEGFQYERLTVVLLKAIQELSAEIETLKQKVN